VQIIDLGAYQDRIWMLYDTASELDVLLVDLRHAVHGILRTPGAEIDLRYRARAGASRRPHRPVERPHR
jgi:hypothetical protein